MELHAELSAPELSTLKRDLERQVVQRAFRRTAKGAYTAGVKNIGEELDARRRDIKRSIRFKIKVDPETGMATIDFMGWSLPLEAFNPRQTAGGVTVKIKGKRKLVRTHFIIYGRNSGKRMVVRRRETKRLPLNRAYTTGVSAQASNDGFVEHLQASAAERFEREVTHEIEYRSIKAAGFG